MEFFNIFVFLLIVYQFGNAAKILGFFPTPSLSHQQTFHAISKELALRGHDVISINPNVVNDKNLTNLKEIDISQTYSLIESLQIIKYLSKNTYNSVKVLAYWKLISSSSEMAYEDKNVQKLLRSDERFDILIVQALHPLTFALAAKYMVPVIGVSSYGVLLDMHDALGNPTHPITNPDLIFAYDNEMNFWIKLNSVLYNIWYRMLYYYYELPKSSKLAQKYFGDDIPYLGDIVKNVSLLMLNVNPILHQNRPNVPNIIELNQIHLRNTTPLPQDIKDFLDSSTSGVVYFSLGTNVQSAKLPERTRREIISALSELPYNVLWKWEVDVLPSKAKNIFIKKWLPQQDVLSHPNLKVFVTQGGLQSLEEAILKGVPIVGIPFVSDQPRNVAAMVGKGLGLRVDPKELTKDALKNAILEVAGNGKYREAVLKAKRLLEDQPLKGLDKAIWWIEYVIRNRDVSHLRSPAANMSFLEYFMLDVILFLFLALLVIGYVFYKIINVLFSRLRSRISKKVKKS